MASEELKRLKESNIDFEKEVDFLYDYGNIKPEHKKLTSEILKLIEDGQNKNHNWTKIKQTIKTKFEIEEIPMMKIEDSLWFNFCKDEKLGQSLQGYKTSKDENNEDIRVPIIGFTADLEDLNNFIKRIITKVNNMKQK